MQTKEAKQQVRDSRNHTIIIFGTALVLILLIVGVTFGWMWFNVTLLFANVYLLFLASKISSEQLRHYESVGMVLIAFCFIRLLILRMLRDKIGAIALIDEASVIYYQDILLGGLWTSIAYFLSLTGVMMIISQKYMDFKQEYERNHPVKYAA